MPRIKEATRPAARRKNVAVWLAFAIVASGGFAHGLIAKRFAVGAAQLQVENDALDQLPLEFGGWRGCDEPLQAGVVEATGAELVLSRAYRHGAGIGTVHLFLVLGGRMRDMAPHRPDVCYPGAGWNLSEREEIEINLGQGRWLPCELFRFGRGGFSSQEVLVLSYYVINGRFEADVSALRSLAWHATERQYYALRVQLSMESMNYSDDVAAMMAFAAASAPFIHETVTRAVKHRHGEGLSASSGDSAEAGTF